MYTPKLHALIVGINNYTHITSLNRATNDAADLVATLRDGAIPTNISLLTDVQATKQAILAGLEQLARQAKPGDTALFYMSGHGGRTGEDNNVSAYFCPVEASMLNLEQTCINSEELTTALRAIKAARLIVLLDTCYSGGIGSPRHNRSKLSCGLTQHDITTLVEGQGRVILAASRPDEVAWELHGMRNGLFTHFLLAGLQGGAVRADGTVWVSDLFSYVSREIRSHGRQHPYQQAIGEDFVVILQPRVTFSSLLQRQIYTPNGSNHKERGALRMAMRDVYNRNELKLLCYNLDIKLENISGEETPLEIQLMQLIEHCYHHGQYWQLVEQVSKERPHLALESAHS